MEDGTQCPAAEVREWGRVRWGEGRGGGGRGVGGREWRGNGLEEWRQENNLSLDVGKN